MNIQINEVTHIDQIKQGDRLIFTDGKSVFQESAKLVKKTSYDGVEVIYKKKANKYFNVGMYLKNESWVKKLYVVSM